ncbi:GNAT family N-acetyltransferase [Beduini massiliensis]|uniref:GNAT family N-acetyltransferase n=1 Tax=Beduini massiliensis TaxID=1585974 RepID=UPI0009423231|nr:GNAT family N-acetyltransferase [Beduini massiliensis]
MTFLETKRLRLRNIDEKDIDEMFDYRNNQICAKYQRKQEKNYEKLAEWATSKTCDTLNVETSALIAVALKETDSLIGEITVMPNDGTISFGYTFSYKVHRKGYAFEALSTLIDYLHSHYPEWDYVCFTDVDNIPSKALLKKLGYTDLGYLYSKDSQIFGKWLRPDTIEEIAQAVR